MLRLTIIERYVLKRTSLMLTGVFLMLSAVILLINFVAQSRDVGQRSEVPFFDLLGLAALQTPSVMVILLPFVFLFGTLAAFVNLNRRSELVAMRAAGVSAWRFIFPAGAAAFVVGVAVFTLVNPLVTVFDRQLEAVSNRVAARADGGAAAAPSAEPQRLNRVWVRQGDRRTQLVLGARPEPGPGVRMSDVTLMFYTVDRQGTPIFTRRIDAPRGVLRDGRWVLSGARDVTPGAVARQPAVVSVVATEQTRRAFARLGAVEHVSFWQLPRAIARSEAAGLSSASHRLRLHQLLATPAMLAGMSLLAAAFSLRLLRLGNLALVAGSGVALGFVFFFFNDLCGALGRAGFVQPYVAAWTPPALVLLSGFILLCYTEDG